MRKDFGLFLTSAFTAAELLVACGAPKNAVRAVTPTPIVRSTGSDRLPMVPLYDMDAKITSLIRATSEKEIWENAEKIAPLTYEAYCRAFPGCIEPMPQVLFVSAREYSDKLQTESPTHYRFSDEELQTFFATTLRDRTIIFNKDQRRVRQAIKQGLFVNVVNNIPFFLLEQQFFADKRNPRQINLSIKQAQSGTQYILDRVYGFEIEETQTGFKFSLMEQAASFLALQEVSSQMGHGLYGQAKENEVIGAYLQGRMNAAKMTIQEVVALHRQSDLDTLLRRIYPNIPGENDRMLVAIAEFSVIQNIQK